MKLINISKSKYGSYGGGLKPPFRYLYAKISDVFNELEIVFPYDEIEICLAYMTNNGRKNQNYKEWYEKLPSYYRGKNKVKVTLATEKQEENIENVFSLIEMAFEIILKKKKKTDCYSSQQVMTTLFELKQEISKADLWELEKKYENIFRQERIMKNLKDREERQKSANIGVEHKRLIKDIRFSHHIYDINKKYFIPYSNHFCEIILEKLRKAKFRLPNYDHLYINVADTFDNALEDAIRLETWFVYGIAIYDDFENYKKLTEKGRKQIIFNLIKEGLYDIAKIDQLDMNILRKALDETESEIFKS